MPSAENTGGLFSRFKTMFISSNETTDHMVSADELIDADSEIIDEDQKPQPVFSNSGFNMSESITEKEISVRTVSVTAPPVVLPTEKDLDIRFATRFLSAGGKFIYCESIKEAIANIEMLKAEQQWNHVFSWENEVKDAFTENGFQRGAIGFNIGTSDAAISLCESMIAEDGTVILNPKQASRRRLGCFPKTHIILSDVAHLVSTESEALEKFYQKNKGELPALIKLGNCNNGHFYDKSRLILNAEGTEDTYVILVDEIIPASLRP